MTTRKGKIARLSDSIREQLNIRLQDGEEARSLLDWLNRLPQTRKILDVHFAGNPVTEQNLSEWRQGGYREWRLRHELIEHAAQISQSAGEIQAQAGACLLDNLATVLTARYAALLAQWGGELQPDLEVKVRVLSRLCKDIARLQRTLRRAADYQAATEKAAEEKEELENEKWRDFKLNVLLEPFHTARSADIYGGGNIGEYFAKAVFAIKHDLEMPEFPEPDTHNPTKSNQIQPKSSGEPDHDPIDPNDPDPAKSNQIKPKSSPQPQKTAPPKPKPTDSASQPVQSSDSPNAAEDD